MLNMDQIPWHEMDIDGFLVNQVEDPYWRGVETMLRRTIYRFEHMPVDMVVEPYIVLSRPITYDLFGMRAQVNTVSLDQKNDVVASILRIYFKMKRTSKRYRHQQPRCGVEEEKQIIQEAEVLFQGLAPFYMAGMNVNLGLWDVVTHWMGIEICFIELMDRRVYACHYGTGDKRNGNAH